MRLSLKSGPSQNLVTSCHKQNHQTENTSCKKHSSLTYHFSPSKKKNSHHVNISMYSYILVYKTINQTQIDKTCLFKQPTLKSNNRAQVQISIFVAFKCVNITLLSTSCFMQHAPYFEFAKKFMKHQNTCKALIR